VVAERQPANVGAADRHGDVGGADGDETES
jgi:hypothetical protein